MLFFPSPKQQKSCRPSCPPPVSPHSIHHSQGEGSGTSTKHPHPWDLCQDPPGWRGTADWRALAPRSTHLGSSTQPTASQGSCWLEDSLGRGKNFAPLPFWCSPAAQWGYGHCVCSVCTKLPGWEPKDTNQLVPVPPACLPWGSASASRSLAEAAWSCLPPAPAASYLLWAAKQSSMFPQPRKAGLLQAEQAAGLTPHTEGITRLLKPGRDFARGTEGNLRAGVSPNQHLLSASLPGTHRAEEELHPWTRTIFISLTQNCTGGRFYTHRGHTAAGPWELGQAAGGRIHTEKFVSSEGPMIDGQDRALCSWAPAPATGQLPPHSRIETLNKYIQHLLGWAGTGWVGQGSVAHFYFRCLEREKRG